MVAAGDKKFRFLDDRLEGDAAVNAQIVASLRDCMSIPR
jgi:hypothetical protein